MYFLKKHTMWTCKDSGFPSSTFVSSSLSLSATRQQKENISGMKKEGKQLSSRLPKPSEQTEKGKAERRCRKKFKESVTPLKHMTWKWFFKYFTFSIKIIFHFLINSEKLLISLLFAFCVLIHWESYKNVCKDISEYWRAPRVCGEKCVGYLV